jgi:hypothetical protein
MAKNNSRSGSDGDGAHPPRGTKSTVISNYLKAHKGALPKEVVAALKQKGVRVTPEMVSVIRAKAGVKKARRQATAAAEAHDSTANHRLNQATALEAALTLYKAARGKEVPGPRVRDSFLLLVDVLG